MRQLRCTWRALEDLGLDPALARKRAEALAEEQEVIRAFVVQRSQSPEGQEVTYLPATRVPVHNLHHGRWRALTWQEEEEDDLDVVWLLGVGWHEAGSKDDAYAVLKRRDQQGLLFPDGDVPVVCSWTAAERAARSPQRIDDVQPVALRS